MHLVLTMHYISVYKDIDYIYICVWIRVKINSNNGL